MREHIKKSDPTNKYKNRLIILLKKIKAVQSINNILYKKTYPTGAVAPNFYWLPTVHRRDIPLKPIGSSRGTTTYEVAKELAWVLTPLVDRFSHHIKNIRDFVDKSMIYSSNKENVSPMMSALFTAVPTDPTINITRRKLELDHELHHRASMTVQHIISLLQLL